MKKKFSLVALMLAVICLFASCTHTHYYAEWETVKRPTCTENGEKVRYCTCGEKQSEIILAVGHSYIDGVCSSCGDEKPTEEPTNPDNPACQHTETEILAAVEPTCTETGLTEGSKCFSCGEIIVEQDVVDANGHSFYDRACTVCGEWDYSKGLEFVSNGDGSCYVKSIGNCTDTEIIIPEYSPENDKVTSIGARAFSECNDIISIRVSKNITSIKWFAFERCEKLKNIILPEGLTELGRYAFQYCTALESIVIPDSVTMIEGALFIGCTSLVNVTVSSGATYFEASAFNGCTALESIVISASVNQIDAWVFKECVSLTSIFFECSEQEFANLTIDSEYAYLSNATEYYYLETKPTQVGNYWHYVDGIATIWPEYYSEGLVYSPNGDGACYVSDIGTCTDSIIIIPAKSPDGYQVTGIGDFAFYSSNITGIVIPEGVTSIGMSAFNFCTALVEISLPSTLNTIAPSAFQSCRALESIILPAGLTKIDNWAFYDCSLLAIVYYLGSVEELEYVSVGDYNAPIVDAVWYSYSENEPVSEGDFWHYVDGIPTPW